jgi:DNA invertase Pin-like site-specific DNA recombinase
MGKPRTNGEGVTRVVIYSRVSTRDQHASNQLAQLRKFATDSGWQLTAEYVDKESGASTDRPNFQQLMDDAGQRLFDVVLFWSLDRFTREGVAKTFEYLARLKAVGVEWHNFTLPESSSDHMFGDVFLAISAAWAQIERQQIKSRTRAGMERAAQEGRLPGRPKTVIDGAVVDEMRQRGMDYTAIGVKLGTSRMTAKRRHLAYLATTRQKAQGGSKTAA